MNAKISRRRTKSAWMLALLLGGAAAAAKNDGGSGSAAPLVLDPAADEFVGVKKADEFQKGGVTVMTQAVAIKETGPKETVARFGEVYAFTPSFIAARRDVPLLLRFWNLQPDDQHDFSLLGPDGRVLVFFRMPPLSQVSYIFTFHKEGPFDFNCSVHQPGMGGQILVVSNGARKKERAP